MVGTDRPQDVHRHQEPPLKGDLVPPNVRYLNPPLVDICSFVRRSAVPRVFQQIGALEGRLPERAPYPFHLNGETFRRLQNRSQAAPTDSFNMLSRSC